MNKENNTIWVVPVGGLLSMGYVTAYSNYNSVSLEKDFRTVFLKKPADGRYASMFLMWDKANADGHLRGWKKSYAWMFQSEEVANAHRRYQSSLKFGAELTKPVKVWVKI